ncbi:MAG: hypothetical protein PHW04_18285 [Candidatus Wallbacteria bacterium]|nr:hypothetical protein [Candidatus Wallbacteria bacterium]
MPFGKYHPLFLEELFIVHLYGSDDEVALFYRLMDDRDNPNNIVVMATLLEDIKRKNLTKMNWFCCTRCQNFEMCRINWYRGERNLERNCCTYCQIYEECYKKFLPIRKDHELPAGPAGNSSEK